jgi:hypothetical protein
VGDDQVHALLEALDRVAPSHALHLSHDLGEGEHADQHREEGHAAFEPRDAEGEARLAHHRVVPQDRHHTAERPGEQALQQRALHQARDHRQREDEEREVLPWPEPQRERGERAGGRHQHDGAEQAAEDRRPDAQPQRAAGLALARHREAVERGGDGGGLAGNAEQARGD